MAAALRQSAYSTNIKTRADFSCALFDRHLQTVAQAFAQPVHLGSLSHLVPTVVRKCGEEEIDSTTVIHPGYRAEVDRLANLLLTKSSPGST